MARSTGHFPSCATRARRRSRPPGTEADQEAAAALERARTEADAEAARIIAEAKVALGARAKTSSGDLTQSWDAILDALFDEFR